MSRISQAFQPTPESENLFLPYLCAGDPSLEMTEELILTCDENGADVLEVGLPFSDPIADGPTVQKAVLRSFDAGVSVGGIFESVASVREKSELPLVLMTYYNPILRHGEEEFLSRASQAGFDGILVVDLPPEEGLDFYEKAATAGLETVLLATPTTSPERIEELSDLATGFIYYVMVTGVTGERGGYDARLADRLAEATRACKLPMVAGFGVSGYEMVEPYLDYVDGVVSGSAVIQRIEDNLGAPDKIQAEVGDFISSLAAPLHAGEN